MLIYLLGLCQFPLLAREGMRPLRDKVTPLLYLRMTDGPLFLVYIIFRGAQRLDYCISFVVSTNFSC